MKQGHHIVQHGRRFLLVTSLALLSTMLYLVTWHPTYIEDVRMVPKGIKEYAVDTQNCKIVKLDPFHPSVAHLDKPAKPIKCSANIPPLVIQGPNRTIPALLFLKEKSPHYGANVSCFYQAIHRVSEDVSVLNRTVHKIDKPIVVINDEFIKVNCVSTVSGKQRKVYEDFFAFIQKKPHVEKRIEETLKTQSFQPDEKLSVLLLMIDSVAKSHFHRLMVKTERYLREKVPMVEMFGYNKIGKNTFPVMLPFLTGFVETEVNNTKDRPVDFLPFVWRDYTAAGYRTLFSEDNANTAIFRYVRKGFGVQPSDYYWRPLKIAFQSEKFGTASSFGCIKGRSEAISILNWTLEFFDSFPKEPLFALTLLSYFTHDYLSTLSRYDEPFLQFIQKMNSKNHLNRTIVIFFSDHGFRFGEARQTYIGRMEGKLPFLFFLIPSWFQIKYPHIMENLKQNANRLITVLDLHAILKDFANFTAYGNSKLSKSNRGHSINLLRTVVSDNRTCMEAKIPLQYCACTSRQQVSVTSSDVLSAAIKLLDKINELTKPLRESCKVLKLVRIHNAASQVVPMDETMDTKSSIYQVTIQVKPGDGIFEGSVWHLADSNVYTAEPTIERVNRYGNQSACITESAIKPFCFCH